MRPVDERVVDAPYLSKGGGICGLRRSRGSVFRGVAGSGSAGLLIHSTANEESDSGVSWKVALSAPGSHSRKVSFCSARRRSQTLTSPRTPTTVHTRHIDAIGGHPSSCRHQGFGSSAMVNIISWALLNCQRERYWLDGGVL
jgi:hypothetical protein